MSSENAATAEQTVVRHMGFSGQGTFKVKKDQVGCTLDMEVTNNGDGIDFFAQGENAGNFFGGTMSVTGGSTSLFTRGKDTVIQASGHKIEIMGNGDLKINDHRYTPYTPRRRLLNLLGSSKKVFLPDGFKIVDAQGDTVADSSKKDENANSTDEEQKEVDKKVYSFLNEIPRLEKITASGQAHVHVDKETLNGKDLEVQLSGQASFRLQDGVKIARGLTVIASGQASFGGPIRAKSTKLIASGQSSIKNVHSQEACDARTSGQASIYVTAEPSAHITKQKSGQSSTNVSKEARG